MSCMMLDLLEIYVTACERQEQEVEEALKEVEALHLSLRTAQQHFPTADLAAKPALWSQMDANVDLALKTFKAIKVHFLTLDGITTTVFNPDRVALNFGPRNFGHLHNSARDSLLAFGAIRANMVAFVSEEEADTKRNMEEKLLHLGQVLNDQGLEPDKQALEDLEWQIWRAEILFLIYKGGLCKTATEHKEQIRYFSQQDLCELFSLPKEGFDVSLTQQQLYEENDRQHTMDKYFKSHIEFLETQGIGGVSHHSLLFSKTAPLPVAVGVEEEVERIRGSSTVGSSFSSSLKERNVNGAEYAFKPKDVNINKKPSSPIDADKLTESEIKQRINRLSQTLANKAMVSRLPDKGEKIQKQIGELNAELYRPGKVEAQGNERNGIDLELNDDITGEFQRVVI